MVEKKPVTALCSAGISPDTNRNNVSVSAILPLDLTSNVTSAVVVASAASCIELDVWPVSAANKRYNSSKNISVH